MIYSKSPQVSRTLLGILDDLSNTVVWMVSILLLISSSLSFSFKAFGTVLRAPIKIRITVTLNSLFSSLASSNYLFIFLFSLIFTQCSGRSKSPWYQILFFLLLNTRFDLQVGIRWSICISKSKRILCIWFSRTYSGLRVCVLVVWTKFNLLHNS